MKTLLQTAPRFLMLAAVAGLGFASPAQAGTPQPVNVDKVGDMSYLVRVSNPSRQKGELTVVRADNGTVLYRAANSKNDFGGKFNFSNLPDGQYAFVVKVGAESYRYAFSVRTSSQRTVELAPAATPQATAMR